jgi:hypothetical protein
LLVLPDPALQAGVNEALATGLFTSRSEVTAIDARNVSSFEGIECLPQLKSLFVTTSTPDLSPIARLHQLEALIVDDSAADAKSGKPFFLYLPLASPHTPIAPSSEWRGKSGLNYYGDFVMQTDEAIGQLLAALDRQGLAGDTLVVLTSDNGCSPSADLSASDGAITSFHRSLDAGNFDAIYDGSATDLKSVASRDKLAALLSAVHRKLGAFKSGSNTGWNDNVTTSGHYLTVNYAATYEHGPAAEEFVFNIANGKTALAGYHINSDALILN